MRRSNSTSLEKIQAHLIKKAKDRSRQWAERLRRRFAKLGVWGERRGTELVVFLEQKDGKGGLVKDYLIIEKEWAEPGRIGVIKSRWGYGRIEAHSALLDINSLPRLRAWMDRNEFDYWVTEYPQFTKPKGL